MIILLSIQKSEDKKFDQVYKGMISVLNENFIAEYYI